MTSTDTQLARRGAQQQIERAQAGPSLEMVVEMTGYSLPEIALIRHNMAAGMRCSPEDVPFIDVAMFCKATKSLGLDPLVKQVYWISRQGKGGLQLGIDGLRAIADRAGNYAGSEPPTFRGTIEWEHRGRTLIVPEYAQVVTWKIVQGHKCAFTGEARWIEYVPKAHGAGAESDMWAKMPHNQLSKCAEGQSLRKGWALQLSRVEFTADTPTEGELPEIATPPRIVEQPQPVRPRATAADYDRTVAAEYDTQDRGWAPVQEPQVDAEDDAALDEIAAMADALTANKDLLKRAHAAGKKGLGKHTADPSWSLERVLDANRELEALLPGEEPAPAEADSRQVGF
jgi:hypothetical protein